MSPRTELQGTGWTARFARGVVWFVFFASCVSGLAIAVTVSTTVTQMLATGQLAISLEVDEPLPADAVENGGASIANGGYDTAAVVVDGLSATPLVLATISTVVGALASVLLAVGLAVIAWRLLHGTLFTTVLWKTVATAGATALIGGIIAAGLHVATVWTTVGELNGAAGIDGFWPMVAGFDPGMIALGMGLLLVALAFEYAASLQRDTTGLV
ncbi:hypothetical protein [Marisediminicola senii]|uniref:hypothetical protein n=1 Tax=Marisediminicola senii TaxID=2711233 RepID=UPI0013EA4EA5|nr:hypothetical protein [Marisediminicola senii]